METQTIDPHTLAFAPAGRFTPFRTAAVLGAGTMGAQIAAHLANAGLTVYLLDLKAEGDAPNALVEKSFAQAKKARPDPFFTEKAAQRVRLGNFEQHFGWVGEVDWVIEAVVERLDVKREVIRRIADVARTNAVVSTNTSGIPIAQIVEGMEADFSRRFLGTHFFNPPRYLKLLELVPSPETDPQVLARVAHFGRVHLGKGVVVAKDTPYFIGNRIGVYGMMGAMRAFTDGDYSIEEVDALTGPLVGRPRSATFRTADVVGLDVMRHVANNLHEAVPDDERREAFRVPDVLNALVEKGALGQKTRAGFYQKKGSEILSIDPSTGAYTPAGALDLGDLDRIRAAGGLPERLRALYDDDGRAGAFFRNTTLDLLAYAARRIPEVTDSPADVDRAIRWGFGWEMGPFELWDALGFDRVAEDLRERGEPVPAWIEEMAAAGRTSFYRETGGMPQAYAPGRSEYMDDPRPGDEVDLAAVAARPGAVVWQNREAAMLDLGDGVMLYQFRSKANTLGRAVMQGLAEVIDRVESDPDVRGLVIGNDGTNFSVGANLGEVAYALQEGAYDRIEGYVADFQAVVLKVRYATKPVVVAVHQRVLGGGCELAMASSHPVAAAESYLGLVELGVGVIPAGTGTTHLAALAADRAPHGHPSEIQPWVQVFFENVAMARVAESAPQAMAMGYLADGAVIAMNADRRLFAAKQEVIRLSEQGYRPPAVRTHIRVLGRPTRAALEVAVTQYREGKFISEYDAFLASQFAYVLTGGDLTAPQDVHEDYLLGLEREVFMRLLGEDKTQARIRYLLENNRPLRN